MAGCAAIPLHLTFHVHRNCVSNGCFLPHSSYSRIQRRCSLQSSRVVRLLNSCEFSSQCARNPIVNPSRKDYSMRCYCLGTLINTDGATLSEWIPIVDQVLLMASIFLTYMAGVIPAEKVLSSSRNSLSTDHALPGDTTFSGRSIENDEEVNLKLPWDIVEEKLMDALNAIEHGDHFGSPFVNSKQDQAKRPLSLDAVAVDNISGRSGNVSMNDWSTFFSDVIQKSIKPVCMEWLNPDKPEILSLMVEKLMGEDTILRNIRNSGKEGLYEELAQFLIFGSRRRDSCCYDSSLFTQHGVAILEDLVITLADGIASVYLELISVDGNMSNEINSGLMLCTLSTRELQKLRNEVALDQWLHQNMEAVVSMYEDRFDLRTLQSQVTEGASKMEAENFSWWKKLALGKSKSVSSPFRYVVINHVSVTVKRTKELRALTGWRYYFSLFLELADITMPLIKTVFAKVSDAISFFLVCLIGRSLGLIYTGIRQSLRWKS
ncbi:Ycf55-like protein [Actinidia chinensis var. chinensis]|uniref:Ycf55-like protein n=1 Tax=Actinidia chinensis var. chinensis TaxID=1590841 RepID=A0A2R6P6V1_ACTCC|nr:Ycf55-like protein [Actinidia chinensis var. chinensis]